MDNGFVHLRLFNKKLVFVKFGKVNYTLHMKSKYARKYPSLYWNEICIKIPHLKIELYTRNLAFENLSVGTGQVENSRLRNDTQQTDAEDRLDRPSYRRVGDSAGTCGDCKNESYSISATWWGHVIPPHLGRRPTTGDQGDVGVSGPAGRWRTALP